MDWSEDGRARMEQLAAGDTVCVSMRPGVHPHLIAWAKVRGLFVRIDRQSAWGIRSCWDVTVTETR